MKKKMKYQVGVFSHWVKDAQGRNVKYFNWSKEYSSLQELFAAMLQHEESFIGKEMRISRKR